MKQTSYSFLLGFTLFGTAMWFFGNLYEAVVLGPNMIGIGHSYERLLHWQQFFVVTNPVHFYVPFTQLALVTLLVLYFKTSPALANIKSNLGWSSVFQLVSLIITVCIITQINFTIFFGDLPAHKNEVATLAFWWNVLNLARLLTTGIGLYFFMKAYIRILRMV